MSVGGRLSLFVAPATVIGGTETVHRLFMARMGCAPTWSYSGSSYHAVGLGAGAQVLRGRDERPSLALLHGHFYREGAGSSDALHFPLQRLLQDDPVRAAIDLRGSFVVVTLATDAIHVILDRVGSRKLFRWDSPEGTWLDTDLRAFLDRPVDPAGVASLVVNRFVYGGRTVLKDVTAMPRASVAIFDGRRWTAAEYWTYGFAGAQSDAFARDLPGRRAELWSLLRQAVRRRIPDGGSSLLFLSGGVDSRAIMAALMAEGTSWRDIVATSYGAHEDDDAVVAGELAARAGLSWSLQPGPEALPDLLDANARFCGGQVFFYPRGLNGVEALTASMPGPVTAFVGDECYGWNAMSLSTRDDVLTKGVGIRAPALVPSYYSYGDASHASIIETLQADIEVVRGRYADVADLHDLKDLLYLDQRLHHMLLPWRECHLGPFARVVNPHIDEDILDFMMQVPTEYRLDKRLFRETAMQNFGELGQVRFARSGGCSNDFLDELFLRHHRAIDEQIASTSSALDGVLPAELIRIGLDDLCLEIRGQRPGASALVGRAGRAWQGVTRRLRLARLHGRRAGATGSMSLSPIQMGTVLELRQFFARPAAPGSSADSSS